jgi:hypothetical protein
MGSDFQLTLEFHSPNGKEKIVSTHITGNLAAIAIVAQKTTLRLAGEVPLEQVTTAEEMLHRVAIQYIENWNQAEEELAALMGLVLTRPAPTAVTVGGVMDVSYLLDVPQGLDWKGLFVDAGMRAVETTRAVGPATGQRQSDFMRLSALQGSILENRVFEEAFHIDSISTAKLLSLANAGQVPMLNITRTNIDTLLPPLPFNEAIKNDIRNAVNQNLTVRIPQAEITYVDWTGIGYLKENPATGECGYMLSGMVAGGMTAGGIDKWEQFAPWGLVVLNKLKSTNNNPQDAFTIYKMGGTDREQKTVGDRLPLYVQVFDKQFRPVKGAEVTFSVKAGGGVLEIGQQEGNSLVVKTDDRGIAWVTLRLGIKTEFNPTYAEVPGQPHPQRIGENIVYAMLTQTQVYTRTPFVAYGTPKSPHTMKKTWGDGRRFFPLSFAGFVSALIEDEHGNPIANAPVDFFSQTATERDSCAFTYSWRYPRALLIEYNDPCLQTFPTADVCKTNTMASRKTDSLGSALIHVIIGDAPGADYPIEATHGSPLLPGALKQTFTLSTPSIGNCPGGYSPESWIGLQAVYPTDAYGRKIDAVQAGGEVTLKAKLGSLREGERALVCGGVENPSCIEGSRSYTVGTDYKNPVVTFDEDPGMLEGKGVFSVEYPCVMGRNDVPVKASAQVTVRESENDCSKSPPCQGIQQTDQTLSVFKTITVYGVVIQGVQLLELGSQGSGSQVPVPQVKVDHSGNLKWDYAITYGIMPTEYKAESAFVVILKEEGGNHLPVYYIPTETEGSGRATLAKGYRFQPGSDYYAMVILNIGRTFRGRSLEVKSDLLLLLKKPEVGELTVTPEDDLKSSGPDPDGHFKPGSKTYTLKNTGKAPLDYNVLKLKDWLSLSSIQGSIEPGKSAEVTVSIVEEEAKKLEEGEYGDTIVFINSTTGLGNTTRNVELAVAEEQLWEVVVRGWEIEGELHPSVNSGYRSAMKFWYHLRAEFVTRKKSGQWTYKNGTIKYADVKIQDLHEPPEKWAVNPPKCLNCSQVTSKVGKALEANLSNGEIKFYWPKWNNQNTITVTSYGKCLVPVLPWEICNLGTSRYDSTKFADNIKEPILALQNDYSYSYETDPVQYIKNGRIMLSDRELGYNYTLRKLKPAP